MDHFVTEILFAGERGMFLWGEISGGTTCTTLEKASRRSLNKACMSKWLPKTPANLQRSFKTRHLSHNTESSSF